MALNLRAGRARATTGDPDIDIFFEIAQDRFVGVGLNERAHVMLDDDERKAVGIRLGTIAKAMILERTNRGVFLSSLSGNASAGARPVTRPYSRNRLSMPTTRTSREDRSGQARTKYETLMNAAHGRYVAYGMASRLTSANIRANNMTAGDEERTRGRRRWITTPHGYSHIRRLAGLDAIPNLQFTGKMMRDLRITVRLIPEKASQEGLIPRAERILKNMLATGRRREYLPKKRVQDPSSPVGFRVVSQEPGFSRGTQALPLYKAVVDIGFRTQRSAMIAYWVQNNPKAPRPFMGLLLEEWRELQIAGNEQITNAIAGRPVTYQGGLDDAFRGNAAKASSFGGAE